MLINSDKEKCSKNRPIIKEAYNAVSEVSSIDTGFKEAETLIAK
jgi:hypothetical protein